MAKNRIIFTLWLLLWLATWAQGKGNMAACILIGTVACAVMEIIIAFMLRKKLTAELSRLEALKAVNPNIRDDELAAIESNRQQVMDALAQAGWRLDALRLIVVTHQ